MEGFVLHLFGPPEVALPHGEPARRLALPKCLASLLALEPGLHPREETDDLPWGDTPELTARRAPDRDAGAGIRAENIDMQAEEALDYYRTVSGTREATMKRRIRLAVAPVALALLNLACHCPPHRPQPQPQPESQAQASATGVLDVPLILQEASNWCWAASGEMIMTFFEHPVSQCVQADSELGRRDCCPPPGVSDCDSTGWPQFERFGFTSQQTEFQALSWDAVKAEIDAGRPVAFSWVWLGGGGHMMVLKGYQTVAEASFVFVNDPRTAELWITYQEYAANPDYPPGVYQPHAHWNDYYAIAYVGGSGSSAPGGTPAGGSVIGPAAAPQQADYDTPGAAAQASLGLLLRSPVLSQSLFHGVKFAGLTVGAGLPDYIVRLDSLRAYTVAKDPSTLLVDVGRVVFPVESHGTVHTSITVRRSAGGWRLASYGAYDLSDVPASSLGTVAAAGQAFLVEVPALHGISFLGARSGTLRLVTLTTDRKLGLLAGQTVADVPGLFAHLAGAAMQVNTKGPQ